ncbi:MAG: hypothetical protein U0521_24960 [Anaerolineae bacterium]
MSGVDALRDERGGHRLPRHFSYGFPQADAAFAQDGDTLLTLMTPMPSAMLPVGPIT